MQKILLHCNSISEAETLRVALETRLPYPVHLSFDEKTALSIVQNRAIHLLAYETNEFSEKDLDFTMSLKRAGFNAPTLVLSEKVGPDKLIDTGDQKLFFLGKPFDEKAFVGVAKKLMVSRTLVQQKHKRYPTLQSAILETFLSGEMLPSQICNLSAGGAYCEFLGKIGVSVGDLVKLKIRLQEVNRDYVMNAKVVWLTRNGSSIGGIGVGVKFIKYDDIYRQLMEKV